MIPGLRCMECTFEVADIHLYRIAVVSLDQDAVVAVEGTVEVGPRNLVPLEERYSCFVVDKLTFVAVVGGMAFAETVQRDFAGECY